MIRVDYGFREQTEVADAGELEQLFHDHTDGHLRILGTGTAQDCLPAPPAQTTLVSLRKLDQIERLEAADLTCSVQPGLLRAELDAELDQKGIYLPCAGGTTLGGMFAADSVGSLAPGAPSPRSLLLGLEGMLPEGLPFRCGARVVKSVAGFDLHKLFVGSRGLLFTATLMHLKLRPKPAAELGFCTDQLDQAGALRLFSTLRQLSDPPAALVLRRLHGVFSLHGVLQGTAIRVSETLRQLGLSEDDGILPLCIDGDEHCEVLRGQLRPSRLPDLLAEIPESAPILVTGGGRFEVALDPGRTNIYLGWLSRVQASAEIARGNPARRGRGTAQDPNAASIMQGLKLALDPGGVLV